MLVLALVFAALAVILFLVEWLKSNYTALVNAGLAALSGAIALFLVDLLEKEGKF